MSALESTPQSQRALRVCVYCGSRMGARPAFEAAARALGQALGARGWSVVYGGGKVGLMGTVADAALQAGAAVLGVIPQSLMDREVGHGALSQLIVVETMHERKRLMADNADAFIALPGGIGTLEELYEVWTWRHLGYHRKPVAILNVDGYYDSLLAFMRQSLADGFISTEQHEDVLVDADIEALLDRIAAHASSAAGDSGDLTRI
jgi:uncharacterized protein (TIGR00730 family)